MNEASNPQSVTKTFCILPWLHLYTLPDGTQAPCCIADLVTEPQPVYRLGSIEEIWNSPSMKELRLAMLSGQRSPVCQRCYQDEDVGMRSLRQMYNLEFKQDIAEAVASTAEDGAAPAELIRSIDLRLGNLCNLRCRMCSPSSSKALIPEWVQMESRGMSDGTLEQLRNLDWFDREEFWQEIGKYIPNIRMLHFTGGEPLLIPRMAEFLERIIEMGYSQNITLSYVTNLTVLPQRLLKLWGRFKKLRLTVSIDGLGEVNSFIRYPAHWPTLERHIKQLDSSFEQLNLEKFTLNAAVQVYNIFRLDELIEYAVTSFERLHYMKLSLLLEPPHLSIQILPPEMKQQAAARLRDFTARFADRWPDRWQQAALPALLAAIDGIIQHMMSADRSDLLPEFRRWSLHQDRFRGQNLLDVIPELAPLFPSSTPA